MQLTDYWHWLGERLRLFQAYQRAYRTVAWPLFLRDREAVHRTAVAAVCQYLARGRVLDIGTGPGRLPLVLTTQAPGLRCVGVDIDPDILVEAEKQKRLSPHRRRLSFRVADVAALPFADRSFHLVTSTMSMHQWADHGRGLREIYRVLRPGGAVLILTDRELVYPGRFSLLDYDKYLLRLFREAGFREVDLKFLRAGLIQIMGRRLA